MMILLSTLAVAFAALCVWLSVRIVNRRERWAKWTLAAAVGLPVLYVLSFGPACWWFSGEPHEPIADEFVWNRWPSAPKVYWPIGWLSAGRHPDDPIRITINWYATRRWPVVMLPNDSAGNSWHSSN